MIVALVGGTTAFITSDKALTVTVDGVPRHIHTFATTVAGVLDEEGIEVGQRDIVAPGMDTKVTDGTRIAVRFGRMVSVNLDGKHREVWTTALTVQQALDQLGIRDRDAFVSVSRSQPIGRAGLAFDVRMPRQVLLSVEGHKRKIETTAETVADAIRGAGVPLRDRDFVLPGLDAYPDEGDHIRVFRVTGKAVTRTESVAAPTKVVYDDTMTEGERSVVKRGKDGSRRVVYEFAWLDGKWAIKRTLVVLAMKKPVDRVVRVGTKAEPPPPAPSPSVPSGSGSGLNWAALAQCESGGNPRAVSPNGLYFGLYQFSLSTWASVGGSGNPIDASSSEQTQRAQILYDRAGDSPWPVCGSRLYT
ncbi:MAG: ubiquitin-like domain-containing protein [Actinomycetes bacterium]